MKKKEFHSEETKVRRVTEKTLQPIRSGNLTGGDDRFSGARSVEDNKWEDREGVLSLVGTPEEAQFETVIDAWVIARLQRWQAEASAVQGWYEAAMQAALKAEPRRPHGRVTLRVRPQPSPPATPGTFSVDWYQYNFARTGARVRCYTTYIPRGMGDQYPASVFRSLIRAWQRPLVMEAEARCAVIRRAVRQIAQVRTQYRLALRGDRDAWAALETRIAAAS